MPTERMRADYRLRLRELCPSFTPDGRKIIFSSNKNECDSRHFELFMINLDGPGWSR